MDASSSTTSTDCAVAAMAFGTLRAQRVERELRVVGHGGVGRAVHGIRAVVIASCAVEDHLATADDRKRDAAADDPDLERAADQAEADASAAVDGRRVAAVLLPLVAGDDRPRAVPVDRIGDDHLAVHEAPDDGATGADSEDAVPSAQREGSVAGILPPREARGRAHECEDAKGDEESPHRFRSI